jgi:hypothetical protein
VRATAWTDGAPRLEELSVFLSRFLFYTTGHRPAMELRDEAISVDAKLANQFQSLMTSSWKSQALYVAAELGIADLLASAPRHGAEMAEALGADQQCLQRLLWALSALGICAEREDGNFELTDLGALLQDSSPHSLRATTLWWGRNLWAVWGNLLYSVRTGKSAREHLLGTKGFQHLQNDPSAAAIFYRMTIESTRITAQGIASTYDFSGAKRIADIGGGHGEVLARVLTRYPAAHGLLFDLPIAVESASRGFAHRNPALEGRCSFVAGDFFESIPSGSDVYVLKSVIHDWNDEESIQILTNCRRAMGPSARLLVIEPIMPVRSEASPHHETLAQLDLTMMVALGAKERTEAEIRELLSHAQLRALRLIPAGPIASIVECEQA